MSKNLKKILVTGASLLMFASVGASISNVNHTANAANVGELQNDPKLFRNPYRSIPAGVNHNFTKHGYTFDVLTIKQQEAKGYQGDIDPVITGIDGNNNVTNHQVLRALEGHHIRLPHTKKHYHKAKKHVRKHVRKHYRHRAKKRTHKHVKRHYRK